MKDDPLAPERQFWQDPHEPNSHYYRWVWEYLSYLTLICEIDRDSKIMELGCSHGRTSRALLEFLRSPGYYRGLDVDKRQVEEATRLITTLAENFQYIHADVYNRNYNPKGSQSGESFVFPFEENEFDCAYAASVYTHLLPEEVDNYFKETQRVLAPGGRALCSFFVLDNYQGKGTAVHRNYEFTYPYQGSGDIAVANPDYPDDAIAYSEGHLRKAAENAGLEVIKIYNGLWSNTPGRAVNEQDLVLIGKPSE